MIDFNSYYSRQLLLPEIGVEGQKKLEQAKCLVVGAGGLGSPALLYLAAAGIGTLGICDGDCLEESNLHRQPIYFAKDLGKSKADLAAQRVKELNPYIHVTSHPFRLSSENAHSLFSQYDLVLDCTDNFRTKFLLNDAAYLFRKPLVRASIYQFEGQLQTYLPMRGDACLRCMWGAVPQEGCVGTCAQVGVLGPVPGLFGLLQAMEGIKYVLGMPTLGGGEILFFDLIHYNQQRIAFERKSSCLLCGNEPSIRHLAQREVWEIECADLRREGVTLIDIREEEETERDGYREGAHEKMPMSRFDAAQLSETCEYVLFCQRGARSARLVQKLRSEGRENVYSLIGGVEALRTAECKLKM
ncbi:MAG: ThiF family adenylyltransferase [Chlamydiales bacterium]